MGNFSQPTGQRAYDLADIQGKKTVNGYLRVTLEHEPYVFVRHISFQVENSFMKAFLLEQYPRP